MQAVGIRREPGAAGMAGLFGFLVLGGMAGIGTALFGPLVVMPIFVLLFFGFVLARPEYGIALFLSTFLMTYPESLQGSGLLTVNNVLGGLFLILIAYRQYHEQDWWFLRTRELHLLAFILLMFYVSDRFNGPDPRLRELLGVVEHGAENLR